MLRRKLTPLMNVKGMTKLAAYSDVEEMLSSAVT